MKGAMGIGAALVAAVLLATGQPAAAGPNGRGSGPGGPGAARWEQRLDAIPDLTTEQRTKIEEIRDRGDAARRTLHREIARAHHAMRGQFLEDEPDAGELKTLTERVGELRTNLELRRLDDRLAVRGVLTEEQRERLSGPEGRPRPGRGDRGGDRRRPGGGGGPCDGGGPCGGGGPGGGPRGSYRS